MDSVYLETTVIGHLAGRFHPDAVVLGRQMITRRWWVSAQSRYPVFSRRISYFPSAVLGIQKLGLSDLRF